MERELRYKKFILYGVFVILCIPAITGLMSWKEKPLQGAFLQAENPDISIYGWFSGAYQEEKNNYLAQNFGFNKTLIRLANQIDFSLFKKAHARFVVVGKENFLYESDYINSYYGKDFIGREKITAMISKIKCVQDTLATKGKLLLPIIAPGKGSFFPEYIPAWFNRYKSVTNYDVFVERLNAEKAEYIDYRKLFVAKKNESKHPLYPKYGIHWSNYGSILAFDSLIKYVEQKLSVDLPSLEITGVSVSDSARHPDDDILKGMNLLSEPAPENLAYPSYSIQKSEQYKKLKLLVIADSFWWYIYGTGLPDQVFDKNRFWFYNEEMYPESSTEQHLVSETNYYESIKEADVILILHSEATLYKFGNGFVDMCYETFCKPDPVKEEIQKVKGIIRATPEWYKQVKIKAAEKDIMVDSMLTLDAIYTLSHK